tara:strand:- start:257 stop:1390 length:1134 start_codon:yes stop_codon:yes gene_type:complete
MSKKIIIIFGTRPEAIKMCPLFHVLQENFEVKICITSQHREMLDQVLEIFEIEPDYDLDIMKSNQDLFDITSNALLGIKTVLESERPDMVLVHGDTTTTMVASLASFYLSLPLGHIEAGLRTYNLNSPFPEEFNRQVTSRLAHFHFAPTEQSKNNLLNEMINEEHIYITGNTVIDALFSVVEKSREMVYSKNIQKKLPFLNNEFHKDQPMILVTGHRRENFGTGMEEICYALKDISKRNKDVKIVYLVHLNPNVTEPVNRILGGESNIFLLDPVDYLQFIKLMDNCHLILTDSGGIQEEAPSLGKPVLVMRDTTERPEAIEAGTVKLIGTSKTRIVQETEIILNDKKIYEQMSKAHNPYGDGLASQRISEILMKEII